MASRSLADRYLLEDGLIHLTGGHWPGQAVAHAFVLLGMLSPTAPRPR